MLQRLFDGNYSRISLKRYSLIIFALIILILLFNIFLYSIISNYKYQDQQNKLLENMEMLNLILEEKKTQMSGYAIIVARFRDLFDLRNDNLLQRRMVDLDSKLGIKGIKVYNDKFEEIYNTGSSFQMEKGEKLSEGIFQVIQEGYSVSFFGENDFFELQINAVSPIYDEYSINVSGFIIVSHVITKEYLQSIANNIDGVIQFFENDDFDKSKRELFADAKYFPGKGYYIKEEQVNDMEYLIAYLPVKDFYSNIIGYFTILKPQDSKYNIVYKLMILSFIYTLVLIFFSCKVLQVKSH